MVGGCEGGCLADGGCLGEISNNGDGLGSGAAVLFPFSHCLFFSLCSAAMATSDSDSSIASDSDFDPAQYEPAALQYEPIGLKLYNPGDVAYEPEVVLREPNKHLSVYNREVLLEFSTFKLR